MSRLYTLCSWLYRPLCWIAVAAQVATLIRCNLHLIVPREVGGSLFGGSMDFMLYLGGWALSVIGLGLAVLTRVPGARLGLIIGALAQGLLGLWWRIHYPDDADGNLIFSIQPRELDYVMVFGFALAYGGIHLLRRQRLKPCPPANAHALSLRILWAVLLAGLFIPPLVNANKQPLPHCAFNQAGEQLSACLDINDPRVIVD